MINRQRRNAARMVLLKAWRAYGTAAFAVDPGGDHDAPLRDAERLGWCSFIDDRCRISRVGVEELAPWGAVVTEAAD